jgi:TIR domain-containing protein
MSENADSDGAWIFVSHSNKDLKKVREIRDILEREGHKPLLFYLKCLNQNDARLPKLIKNEIEARTWFVLCDSDNARNSRWVQEEMTIVKATPDKSKFYVTIDLAKDLESQRDKLTSLSKRATVFISSAHSDADIAGQIYNALIAQDYRVFWAEASLKPATNWQAATDAAIKAAIQRGFVLLLLSPGYLASKYFVHERAYAFQVLGSKPLSNIIPIIVRDPASVYAQLPDDLRHMQCINLTSGPIAERIGILLADLKQRPVE